MEKTFDDTLINKIAPILIMKNSETWCYASVTQSRLMLRSSDIGRLAELFPAAIDTI